MKTEELKNYIKNNNLNYEVLGYNKEKRKYHLKHLECGHEYYKTFSHFVTRGQRCPKCNGGIKYSHNDFIKLVKDQVGSEYRVLGQYINSSTKIKMKHNVCGHEYFVRPANFLGKGKGLSNRCPKCFSNYRKTTQTFKKEVYDLVGDDYSVLSEYKNNKTKIKMKHNICGHEYNVIPKDFIKKNGNRCPICAKSKGEDIIREWLSSKNINFINGYKIEDCRNILPLEFDFRVNYNDSYFLLEYDGRLHFEPWKKGKKHLDHLKRQQKNDKIKNDYCSENGITLYRINYLDDIEKELNKIFSTSTTIESTLKDGSE